MKKKFAMLLMLLQCALSPFLMALDLEVNASYDYFRGLPEGSWNGNSGVYLAGNMGMPLLDFLDFQLGGSIGIYNWDGRDNLVFTNNKNPTYQNFITTGVTYKENCYTLGLVYDYMFSSNFGIYSLSPSVDQLRARFGYALSCTEIGVWGTYHLETSHKKALGIPTSFRAINQANVFLTYRFNKCSQATVWAGIPYEESLMHPHKKPGTFLAGFNIRAPICGNLYLDAHGAYMRARKDELSYKSRNYGANVTLGITYLLGNRCQAIYSTYQPLADNSNFMLDTNINQ